MLENDMTRKVVAKLQDSTVNLRYNVYFKLPQVYRDYRRMPNGTLIVYFLVLAMDLVVGCSIILWKCSIRKSEEECEQAAGGTVGSVIIWLLIMLVCPCFATCIEICVTLGTCKMKCIQYMDKLRPRKSQDIVIHNEAYNLTTTALLEKVSPVDQRSKLYISNETRRARDQTTLLHSTDKTREHIPVNLGDGNQTSIIKYLQPDAP